MRQPTFSVIVAAFNCEDRIEAVTRSVLAQTRTQLELIVVDDGSSDGTAERVERLAAADSRVRLVRQSNRGTVGARNVGLASATGRLLSFLDDDDLWLPGYLDAVSAAFARAPSAGLVYSDAWVTSTGAAGIEGRSALERFALPIRRLPATPTAEAGLRALLRVNFITTCAATFSRPALGAAGELDRAIEGCDDWDLWIRMAAAGFAVVRVPERLVVRRMRPDSLGSDRLMMARGAGAVLEKFLRGGGNPRAERIAERHRRLIEREVRALEDESRTRGLLWGGLRRLGRKRLPVLPAPRPTANDLKAAREVLQRLDRG